MMARILKGLLLLGICVSTQAADVTQTFNDAKTWGAQQQTSIPVQINPVTAQTKVPNYQSTSPATNNYGNGNTSLFGLGSSKVTACASNPTDPQYSSQECNAVNTVAQSPAQRPQFNITKTDPIMQAGSSVINDPSAIAGSIQGTYSACTTKTITSPDTMQTQVCNQYLPVQNSNCLRILVVTCDPPPQTTQTITASAPANGTGTATFDVDFTKVVAAHLTYVMHDDIGFATVNGVMIWNSWTNCGNGPFDPAHFWSCWGWGNAWGGNSMYIDVMPYLKATGNQLTMWNRNSNGGGGGYANLTLTINLPPHCTDSWDDQCATLESRAQ